ncbi:MAG: sugar transferase [Terriglobales bacterium]
MAAHTLPRYLPRRRGWQLALGEAGWIMAVLLAGLVVRFGHDAALVLRDVAAPGLVLACALALLCLYGFDFYEPPMLGDWHVVWRRLPLAGGALALLLASLQWLWPGLRLGPRLGLEAVAAAALAVAGLRPVYWLCAGRKRQRALLVGSSALADALAREIHRHGEAGLTLAGRLSEPGPDALLALAGGRGDPWAHRLVAAFPGGWGALEPPLRRTLETAGYQLEDGATWYERLTGKLPVDAGAPAAAAVLAGPGLDALPSRTTLAVKRLADCLLAAAVLLAAAPLLGVVALLIRCDSPGPVIFAQRRVGRLGRYFTLYKFRSMRVNADGGGVARPACARDPRCTRAGRWLRRLRLDELPQLVNILRGDMSLVGPRPFVPEQEQECVQALPGYALRWSVPPGATGWAQVNRGYCASLADNTEKLAYDLFYIKHMSLGFDLSILAQTLKVVCLGRGGR